MGSTQSSEPLILDVRTRKEYRSGHYCGAVLLPTPLPPLSQRQLAHLRAKLARITRRSTPDREVRVYCKKGIRAAVAVDMLKQLGMRNVTSWGGVELSGMQDRLQGHTCY